jgi:hypothetical protein
MLVIPAQCNTNNITTHKLNRVEHLELEWGTYIAGSAAENRVEDICARGVDATLRNIWHSCSATILTLRKFVSCASQPRECIRTWGSILNS